MICVKFQKLFLCLAILGALYSSNIFSAPEEQPESVRHGLGLAAGGTAGVGLAYRVFFPRGIGLQTTFGAFGTSRYVDMFGGVQLMYKFYTPSPSLSFYGLIGSGLLLESLKGFVMIPGIGAGLEWNIVKGLTAAFEIALAPYVPINKPPTMLGYIPLPFPGLALIYYF